MATFNYSPSYGAAVQKKPRVKSVKFGDGYEQRQPDGINRIVETWDLSFTNRDTAEIDAIDAFLTNEGGATYFDWTPPAGSAGRFICRQWSRSINYSGIHSLSAQFERVYDL